MQTEIKQKGVPVMWKKLWPRFQEGDHWESWYVRIIEFERVFTVVLNKSDSLTLSQRLVDLRLSNLLPPRLIHKLASIEIALPYTDSNGTHYPLLSDSSNYGVGAALHQMINDKHVPIWIFSKKLSEKQRKWSIFDLELMTIYLAVLHFKPQIKGRHVTMFAYHKPRTLALYKMTPIKSDKQQRHLSLISVYVADILYSWVWKHWCRLPLQTSKCSDSRTL